MEESRYLLEKLKELAEIGTDDKPVKSNKNNSKPAIFVSNTKSNSMAGAKPLDFNKLKEIADIATGNETLMNSSAGFTTTRDGVEIFTKILHKMEDRTDKMISTTEKSSEIGNYLGNSQTLLSFIVFDFLVLMLTKI